MSTDPIRDRLEYLRGEIHAQRISYGESLNCKDWPRISTPTTWDYWSGPGVPETTSPAYDAGYERGTSAGSWVFDGNTSEATIRRVLKGCDDGDPEIMDMQPAPLSGEWAGESVPELSERYGLDLYDDDVAMEFESGFSEGYWTEVARSGRAMLPEGDS